VLAGISGVLDVMWVTSGAPDHVVLVHSTNSGGSFQSVATVAIPGDGGGTTRNLSFARAADGTLHVVVEGQVSGMPQCFYFALRPGSNAFTQPASFTGSFAPSLSPVVVVDGAGLPMIVWSGMFGGGRNILFSRISP